MLDVTPGDRRTLEDLIARTLPGVTVWAFGSRVKGTAGPASDLDIVVFTPPGRGAAVHDLREALDESDLPFRVDVLEWDCLPDHFRRGIAAAHEPLGRGPGCP